MSQAPPPALPASPVTGSPSCPRIVAVDHDPVLLDLLRTLLTDEGYVALIPPDPRDPYAFIKQVLPDLVILDVVFRREGASLTTLDKLKLDPATTAIPVLVCTTTPSALEGVAEREKEGGLALVAKPYEVADLLDHIAQLLAQTPPRSREDSP